MALTKIPASFIDTSSGITGDTTVTGNFTVTGYLAGPSTFTIDPAGVGDNTGTVVIAGNLQVDGTTTTINSTTMTVDDLNITLASGAADAAAADGAGITIDGASASLTYSSSLDAFVFNKDVDIDGGTIDGATIGGSSAGAGSFTTLTASGDVNFDSGTLFVDASADSVGIGTSSPAEPLHVQEGSSGITSRAGTVALIEGSGNTKVSIASGTTSTGELLFGSSADNDAGRIIYDHSDDGLQVWTNGSRAVDVDSSGNVGIGYTSPNYKLDTYAGSSNSAVAHFSGSTAYTGRGLEIGTFAKGVADGGAYLDAPATTYGTLVFKTIGSEAMRIDESGNVGIGTTSPGNTLEIIGPSSTGAASTGNALLIDGPSSTNGMKFFVDDSANACGVQTRSLDDFLINPAGGNVGIGTDAPAQVLEVRVAAASSKGIRINEITGTYHDFITDSDDLVIHADSKGENNSNLIFSNGSGGERARIDSSGNVGIGTSSPSSKLHISDAGLVTLRVESTDDSNAQIQLRNVGSTDQFITAQNAELLFEQGSGEAMRIDSSGNLLVGKSTSNSNAIGAELRENGGVFGCVDGGNAGVFNRKSSNGDIVLFRKDGTTVGAVGVTADDILYLTCEESRGIKINADSNRIDPCDGDGASLDNTIDLGVDTARFKDLYLSGTAYTGGLTVSNDSATLTLSNPDTSVSVGQTLGNIIFEGNDASSNADGTRAEIEAEYRGVGGATALKFKTTSENSTDLRERLEISTSGNISFFEDTGSTPKFFWDASAESLGIGTGTGTPDDILHVRDDFTSAGITIERGGNNLAKYRLAASADVFTITDTRQSEERLRINSSGRLLINTTSETTPGNNSAFLIVESDAGSAKEGIYIRSDGGSGDPAFVVGDASNVTQLNIFGDGDVENTNGTYGTISDARVKENITDAASQWEDFKALRIRRYNLISKPNEPHIGVIAQELEEAGMGGLVKDTRQDGMKSVKTSILYMKAIKALQEAMERIETLEAEVAALKGA